MFLINPFLSPAGGDFESIATVVVGSGGSAAIEFTSIPSTYQHLQIRGIFRETSAASGGNVGVSLRFNADAGSNYTLHRLYGSGSSAVADASTSQTSSVIVIAAEGGTTANIFPANILDILDYASTSKNKTIRALVGGDYNGGGSVNINSGLWMSTSAVTSIKLTPLGAANFVQHSTAALYGVKAP